MPRRICRIEQGRFQYAGQCSDHGEYTKVFPVWLCEFGLRPKVVHLLELVIAFRMVSLVVTKVE